MAGVDASVSVRVTPAVGLLRSSFQMTAALRNNPVLP